jgi:hypothetical protein
LVVEEGEVGQEGMKRTMAGDKKDAEPGHALSEPKISRTVSMLKKIYTLRAPS